LDPSEIRRDCIAGSRIQEPGEITCEVGQRVAQRPW
jgi:hypothetical protein